MINSNVDVIEENHDSILKPIERSVEESEVSSDFKVSLVDVPSDGYGYNDSAKINIHVNNVTTTSLDNLVITFKVVKKKLIDEFSSDLHGVNFTDMVNFGGSLFNEYSSSLVQSVRGTGKINKNDPYVTDTVFMRPISVGKRVDTTAKVEIRWLFMKTKGLYIPSKDYLSSRDFDIEYKIFNGSQILGTGVLPIHVKGSDLITSQRQFGLDLTRIGRQGEINGVNFNTYTYWGTRTNVFNIINDEDKKFWLVVRDKRSEKGLYEYVENSKFKFKIPQGFKLDEDALRLYYFGMNYKVNGDTVEVDVRPGDVGLSIGWGGTYIKRGLRVTEEGIENNYFALPLIKNDEQFDTYNFSVDTSGGSFPSVSDLTLNNKQTFNMKSELDLIDTEISYFGKLGNDGTYIYDDDRVSFPSGYTYNISSYEYDTKVNGANLKAISFSYYFFANVQIYGIRSDGSRVALDVQNFEINDSILGEYFKTKPIVGSKRSVVHIPEDIVKVRFEFNKKVTSSGTSYNYLVWDIKDDVALSENGGALRLGVNGRVKEIPYRFSIGRGLSYEYKWRLSNPILINKLVGYLDILGYTYNSSNLVTVDTSKARKHVILKVPKGFSFSFTGGYAWISSFYDILGEEIYGDTKYIHISQKEGVSINATSLTGTFSMLPIVQDGIYDMSSRVYLEGRDTLPSWLIIVPSETGGQEYSFQYDPSRSIKDNYELVTDGTEAHAEITVEKPKILSTTTTVNDLSSLKVTNFDDVFSVKSYITNDSSDPVVHPVLDVVVPDKLELHGEVVVPNGYKVQYQVEGSNDFVDNISDYSLVKKYKVVAVDSTASILPNTSLEVNAPMKLRKSITDNVNVSLKTTVTHNEGTLISTTVNVTSDLQEFKDGVVNVKWVDENGTTLKTQKLTGRHGSKYVVDRAMFTKDGKYYKYVSTDGFPDGTYVGGVTSEVVVHMKEQDISFELPMTGTYCTIGVLSALLGILGIAFVRKRGR